MRTIYESDLLRSLNSDENEIELTMKLDEEMFEWVLTSFRRSEMEAVREGRREEARMFQEFIERIHEIADGRIQKRH